MTIIPFVHEHTAQATLLAQACYNEERRTVSVLPDMPIPDLSEFARNGLGVAAVDAAGQMIGFLCCYPVFDNAFGTTTAKGVFSPVHAHAAMAENRDMIYARMYQAASEK